MPWLFEEADVLMLWRLKTLEPRAFVMKFDHKVLERSASAHVQYAHLKQAFKGFVDAGSAYLARPDPPIAGIKLETNLHENYFDVFFVGMHVRFQFLVRKDSDGTMVGAVIVVRKSPTFSNEPDLIGSFRLTPEGETEYEDATAAEVVLYWLDEALEHQMP